MALNSNFTNTDAVMVSQFIGERLDTLLAPFAALGVDVSAQAPEGSSVKIYKNGNSVSASVIGSGETVLQDPTVTGLDVALTGYEAGFILRDQDIVNGTIGSMTANAMNIVAGAVGALATRVQQAVLYNITGSATAAFSASMSSSLMNSNAILSASITTGQNNWPSDGQSFFVTTPDVYRKVASEFKDNSAFAENVKAGTLTNVYGFNLVETNAFTLPNTAGNVKGFAVRPEGVGIVMRPTVTDPIEDDGEMTQTYTTPGGFVYTLRTWREPKLRGRAFVVETQVGSRVANTNCVYRLINLG